jgi:exodeoxyribonuclease V beta subunit
VSVRNIARPSVVREVPLTRGAVVEASAGTGKTFTISHLVVELVAAHEVPLDRILVVTFTERAKNELRTRVRAEMEELYRGGGTLASRDQLNAGDFLALGPDAHARLASAIHGFDAATITTIHGFCQGVLHDNAFASGRLFEEEQVDGRQAFHREFRRVLPGLAGDPDRGPWIEAWLRGGRSIGRLEELLWNALQTRGEIRPRFDPTALQTAFEDTVRAEIDLEELARCLKAGGTHRSTIKAITDRLTMFVEQASRVRGGDLVECVRVVERSRLASLDDSKARFGGGSGRAEAYLEAATRLAAASCSLSAVLVQLLLPNVRIVLAGRKRELGQYDFDDMLLLVEDALCGPDGAALARSMRARWRYVLVDEFQDTDITQWSIFHRGFLAPIEGAPSSIVHVVGDPKQSIYRFRGADIDTYFRARQEIFAAGGQPVTLADNYRATPALVEGINALFAADAPEPVFSGSLEYHPVGCGRGDRGLVDGDGLAVVPIVAVHGERGDGQSAFGALVAREAWRIADEARPWRLDGRPLTFGDIFVLTRTVREGRVVGDALRTANVPFTYYKEDGLFQTDEASDIRTLLSAVANPADPARRLAAWLTPFFGLPLPELEHVRDLAADHPWMARLESWRVLAERRAFGELFESILRDSRVVRRQIFFDRGERALTNTHHIFEILLESACSGHKTLETLVDELSILRGAATEIDGNVQRLESERAAVQIMTIHKSKGLEAPVVFLAGSMTANQSNEIRAYHEDGERLAWVGSLAPALSAVVKREETEEDERLLYVALTRAMGRVVLPSFADKADSAKGLRSAWRRVNARILQLASSEPSLVAVEALASAGEKGPAQTEASLAWSPSPALLSELGPDTTRGDLRRRRARASVTSYTRMKAERATRNVDDGNSASAARGRAGANFSYGGGRATGIAVHELLERVPLSSFIEPDFERWKHRVDVERIVAESLVAHGVDFDERPDVERLVWAAYTTPIPLPNGTEERLADKAHVAREMNFLFPAYDEAGVGNASSVHARYVQGSLDLVFEDRNVVYFVDWKSDSLPSFASDDVGDHVRRRYDDQVKLYSLAIAKLLRIKDESDMRRFGGVYYCFLRGFGEPGAGVWFARPSWPDLVNWNEDIRRGQAFREWVR